MNPRGDKGGYRTLGQVLLVALVLSLAIGGTTASVIGDAMPLLERAAICCAIVVLGQALAVAWYAGYRDGVQP